MKSITRIHGLDTLRAVAIMLVFMNHYVLFVSRQAPFGFWGEVGWTGVDLFFALSGYLIGNQIFAAMRSEAGFSLRTFYIRRFLRTLPAFYAVLALYACWPWFRAGLTLPPLWQFLTFTQNFDLMPGTAFSHAWSLCVEEQFYVLLPAVALLIGALRRSLVWAWVAVCASFLAGMAIRGYLWQTQVGDSEGGFHYYNAIYYSSLCRFDELVAGVALALLKNHHGAAWNRLTSRGNWALGAGVAVAGAALYLFSEDHYGYGMTVFGYPLLALGCTLLLIAALSRGSLLERTRIPGFGKVALWSYAIYLTHKQIFLLLKPELAEHGISAASWTGIAIMTAVSIPLGWLLYAAIETPFLVLRDRYFSYKRPEPNFPPPGSDPKAENAAQLA
ncbi:acyltransferase family protein [Pseudoduganella aquatica]|uniref:Acyltransferase family protein n=1 Tax=Pseudoduganella aquatica TaxID=2660641 RepID=A0A7X4HEX5_9BURK|nr:acyltransferase [Pseudoduganella aquatica]MYN10008.1 acyltransferase family protein [Pseudoduganella aquatica]